MNYTSSAYQLTKTRTPMSFPEVRKVLPHGNDYIHIILTAVSALFGGKTEFSCKSTAGYEGKKHQYSQKILTVNF